MTDIPRLFPLPRFQIDVREPTLVLLGLPQSESRTEALVSELLRTTQELINYLRALEQYLDRVNDLILQYISERHGVGDLANRPDAGVAGRTYLATDQTPEALFVEDGTNWHQFNSV